MPNVYISKLLVLQHSYQCYFESGNKSDTVLQLHIEQLDHVEHKRRGKTDSSKAIAQSLVEQSHWGHVFFTSHRYTIVLDFCCCFNFGLNSPSDGQRGWRAGQGGG